MTDAQKMLRTCYSVHGLTLDEDGVVRSGKEEVARVRMDTVRLNGNELLAEVRIPTPIKYLKVELTL